MERTPEAQWVKARLDAVAPAWNPDTEGARRRAHASDFAPSTWLPYGKALAAVAGLVAVLLLPPVRPLAQELWYRLTVSRIDVVQLDLSRMPLDTHVRTDGAHVSVATLDEASARAGFVPTLPSADLVPDVPVLTVTSRIDVTQQLRAADLRRALDRVGASDLDIPAAWDGAELQVSVGPLVIAEYEGLYIVQATPIRLQVPTAISLADVAEVMFRAAGSSWWEARALGEAYAASPAWLFDVPEDEQATVEAVPMWNGSTAFVIGETTDDGGNQTTVLVSSPSRLVAVTSASRETSLRVAEAIVQ